MELIKWGKDYEIGVAAMDEQHKKWIGIINKFYDTIGKSDMKKNLELTINEVLEYTKYHFSEEEKFMESIGFSELENQKSMHKALTEKMIGFKNRIVNSESLMSVSVTNELKDWLNNHIKVEDKKYAEFYLK